MSDARLTSDVELLVLMCDESGQGGDWNPTEGRTLKARCTAKQLGPQLGRRAAPTFEHHSELTVTAAEAEEIQDGDLVVQPFMEPSIDAGLDCAWRVVARSAPYEAGGASDRPDFLPRHPSPRVEEAPRGSYVTLRVVPGTVDAEDVQELWAGERRVKPGRERWIPARFRAENADAFRGTAKALGHDPEAARAGKAASPVAT